MHVLVDLCQFIAALVIAPVMLVRSWRTGKYRTDWNQRRGFMPDLQSPCAQKPRVWIHAVSVGEMNAVRGLIKEWRDKRPGDEIVISCTTDTGIARARELFPDLRVIRYPLDFSRFVKRALDRIKPNLIVLVELEVWFNFVTIARERDIPVAIVNGRLSEKSAKWFARIPPIARRMFGDLTWVGAQDETYAERFRRVGVPADRVSVTGSLKWETAQIADSIPGAIELAHAMGICVTNEKRVVNMWILKEEALESHKFAQEMPAYPIMVCGSTGPGEEEIILQACMKLRSNPSWFPNLQLVLVPRKPERFDEVATLIVQHGFICARRSQCAEGSSREYEANTVQLVDTMGELRKAYSLADIVFVGRTFAPMGGSDVMEVAALGKPIIIGPHYSNFRDAVEQLVANDAIRILKADVSNPVESVEQLNGAVYTMLHAPQLREKVERAREVVRRNLGATQRTLDRLLSLVSHPTAA